MVIANLDIMGIPVFPAEAYPPLAVDPYAVLPFPIPSERFKPVARREPQIHDPLGGIEHKEFFKSPLRQFSRKPFRPISLENGFDILVLEAPYHGRIITPVTAHVNTGFSHGEKGGE